MTFPMSLRMPTDGKLSISARFPIQPNKPQPCSRAWCPHGKLPHEVVYTSISGFPLPSYELQGTERRVKSAHTVLVCTNRQSALKNCLNFENTFKEHLCIRTSPNSAQSIFDFYSNTLTGNMSGVYFDQ